MQKHIEAIRRRLSGLHVLRARTQGSEREILDAAIDRLDQVNADIDKLSGRALVDEAAAVRYQALIIERGRLHHVIEQARERLS